MELSDKNIVKKRLGKMRLQSEQEQIKNVNKET